MYSSDDCDSGAAGKAVDDGLRERVKAARTTRAIAASLLCFRSICVYL